MGKSKKKVIEAQESVKICELMYKWAHSHLPLIGSQSPSTINSYKESLARFATFLMQEKNVTSYTISADCFSVKSLREWQKWMKEQGNTASTCNARIAAIKNMLEFFGGERSEMAHLANDARRFLKPMKGPSREVRSISRDAIRALLGEPDCSKRVGFRDYTMMAFLYWTGMRLDEMLSAKIGDITLFEGRHSVRVIGKGNKLRTIPIDDSLVELLQKYIAAFHGKMRRKDDLLFYSPYHHMKAKLSQEAFAKRLRLYAKSAHEKCPDVPLDMHAHIFRHSRATHWREDGVNIPEIMELLGHSSIQSTMIYQTVTFEDKLKAMEKMADETVNCMPKKWRDPEYADIITLLNLKGKVSK